MRQKSRVRFSGHSDTQENGTVHEVQSAGSLRRLPSWNSNLVEMGSQSVNSIRSSESDSSLSTINRLTNNSPGKNVHSVFRVSPDQHLSGGSPDSDVSSEITMRISNSLASTQDNYLQNEIKFVNKEILRVRDSLNNKV